MLTICLVIICGFVFGESFAYFLHKFIHNPIAGRLHASHMCHHEKLYPIESFISKEYRSPGKDNTVYTFAVAIAVLGVICFILLPVLWAAILVSEFIFLGLLNNYLHDSYHIKDHILEWIPGFKRLRMMHYQHHIDMQTNLGIYTFVMDRLFKTYQNYR